MFISDFVHLMFSDTPSEKDRLHYDIGEQKTALSSLIPPFYEWDALCGSGILRVHPSEARVTAQCS